MSIAAPAEEFVELIEVELKARAARWTENLAPYGLPAQIGIEGLRRGHWGSSHVPGRLLGASYQAHGGAAAPGAFSVQRMVLIGAAAELFMDATLAHDDLIARSDTRRGQPSLHRHFEDLHRQASWTGEPMRMGTGLASLAGDAMLAVSGDLVLEATIDAPPAQRAYMTRLIQSTKLERFLGQAMDAVYPHLPDTDHPEQIVERAMATIRAKTARTLAAAPLALGAAGAGAPQAECGAMAAMGLHLGAAYQLHDDVQGALGSPEETGKPAGQDLIDGKRTVLVGLTLSLLGAQERRSFTNALQRGAAPPVEARVEHLQGVIRRSGALEAIEVMIADRRRRALDCLASSGVGPEGRAALAQACDWLLDSARM
ncbi:MAG: polyprenyl synthetase family protein [Bifidobacteriaceae bacterium]|nr:polyprenyl synthetase family protein [Bifidobacteriaceae bacterium]